MNQACLGQVLALFGPVVSAQHCELARLKLVLLVLLGCTTETKLLVMDWLCAALQTLGSRLATIALCVHWRPREAPGSNGLLRWFSWGAAEISVFVFSSLASLSYAAC
mmetsp:Transcript_23125/g.41809  ORF Transcript_23125/g.41809 Transcript_23125/m.41809 type:complete len:108 (-) Transcript_23125:97-420(-)